MCQWVLNTRDLYIYYSNTCIAFCRGEVFGISFIMRNEEEAVVSSANLPELDSASLLSLFTELGITTVQESQFGVLDMTTGAFVQKENMVSIGVLTQQISEADIASVEETLSVDLKQVIQGIGQFLNGARDFIWCQINLE